MGMKITINTSHPLTNFQNVIQQKVLWKMLKRSFIKQILLVFFPPPNLFVPPKTNQNMGKKCRVAATASLATRPEGQRLRPGATLKVGFIGPQKRRAPKRDFGCLFLGVFGWGVVFFWGFRYCFWLVGDVRDLVVLFFWGGDKETWYEDKISPTKTQC